MQPNELFHGIPVVDEFMDRHGQPVKVLCRGDLRDVIIGMKLLRSASLPQKDTTLQGMQRTFVEIGQKVRG
jgi:hypothetical protein